MKQIQTTQVEVNGRGPFDSYRVPGVVTTAQGDVLVCYEGRSADGSRTLLMRRSVDGGHTFGGRVVLVRPEQGELLHNPMLLAGPDGLVWLFWCQDYTRLFMQMSDDNGRSFGPARELTDTVDGFRSQWPLTLWAIAPGHGLCMRDGTLVVPLWLSRGENAHLPACFACLYSTDRGASWQCSNVVPAGNGVGDPTEASVAEKSDGRLLATMRHEIPGVRRRAFCQGGPERWGIAYLNQTLPDPVCAGALLTLKDGRMAFVNCAYGDEPALERQRQGEPVRWSLDARQNLTVRLSEDDGASWSAGLALEREAGASDLAQSPNGSTLYCFYEQGWTGGNCIFNRALAFARIPLSLLEQ
ncbi:MAG: exo-alpha-sialidase [Oscillospiraceae bacterium]|nr:exo-alpha-sialidase [Oscillospiraceae bacterium]